MALGNDEIRLGYIFLLGREPEAPEIYHHYRDLKLEEFRHVLIESPEGQDRIRRLSIYQNEPVYIRHSTPATCFIHLEKTGGTTLHEALAAKYDPARVTSAHFPALHCMSMSDMCNYEFISGHFDYYSTQFIPYERLKRVSLFREPVSRLISMYRFHRSHPRNGPYEDPLLRLAHELSPVEFFLDDFVRRSARINNTYMRVFGSTHYMDVSPDEDVGEIFSTALARVVGLDGIGITERMTDSIELICRAVGKPPPTTYHTLHRTDDFHRRDPSFGKVGTVTVSNKLMDILEPLVRYDREIYRAAQIEFRRRMHSTSRIGIQNGMAANVG
jgi:hypothetical protein